MEIKATNFIVNPKALNGSGLHLNETESHHLLKVFRANKGDIFYAIDGTGKKYRAVIDSILPKKVIATIINTVRLENEPLVKLSLAVGISRPAKIDFIVEKATEIGISKFHFFISERTFVEEKSDRSISRKVSRWKSLAMSAAKQSLRSIIPEVNPPVHLDEILAMAENYQLSLLADINTPSSNLTDLLAVRPHDILLLVGPESGLTDQEVKRAISSGFKTIKLGPRRLRAETAAITASVMVMSQAGEL